MYTKLQLCNIVLARLGQPVTLVQSDLDNNTSHTAIILNNLFTYVSRWMISKNDWSCCIVQDIITADNTAPTFDFAYRYLIPSDCIRVKQVNDIAAGNDWIVAKGYILSNDGTANVYYVQNVTDPTIWNDFLTNAVVARLMADSCLALTGDKKRIAELEQLAQETYHENVTLDGLQGSNQIITSNDLLTIRESGSTTFPWAAGPGV